MQGTTSLINQFYAQQPLLIDTLIYLAIFTGVAQVTLGRRYPGRGGRAIVAGVGLSLTIAASMSAHRSGFTLDRLAPISWIVLGVVLLILIFSLLSVPRWRTTRSNDSGPQFPNQPSPPQGRSYSFHLHTDRMPDPRRWRRRSGASPEAPAKASRVAEAMHQSESTLSKLLDAFMEHVALYGLERHPESFLIAIARTQRAIEQSYHHLLKLLAKSGWRCDPGKQHLAHDVESVMRRAAQHTALFHEAMRFAEAAIHGGNLRLLQESIGHMQRLEHDSIRLTRTLNELIKRLQAQHPSDSSSSWASTTTRGRDAN